MSALMFELCMFKIITMKKKTVTILKRIAVNTLTRKSWHDIYIYCFDTSQYFCGLSKADRVNFLPDSVMGTKFTLHLRVWYSTHSMGYFHAEVAIIFKVPTQVSKLWFYLSASHVLWNTWNLFQHFMILSFIIILIYKSKDYPV